MKLLNTYSKTSPFEGGKVNGALAKLIRGMTLMSLTLIIPLSTISAQTFSETQVETARFQNVSSPDNELYLHNINGNVSVEGYDGNEVQIFYDKEIEADTQRDLERAIEEVEFVVVEDGNRIFIYLDAPFINVNKGKHGISYNIHNWDDDYNVVFDITVQVPRNTNLDVSTINGGKLLVENTRGKWLDASNVNGRVELMNVTGVTDANTVNGDITASYSQSPNENSSYQTINGTIEVLYPDNLSADISFKSMHGDLYTDFENVQRLESRVESDTDSKHGKTTYRIDKFAPLRIGDGGPTFSFEVLNGSVYIKQNRSI
ncbi:MAG: DUF4097 family beta strand repeat protein [Bacteroidetes bacterium]|jgi:hypothetical protein|nr:DUF4097 family beta strand repeat protein [Bacteroidota bacterium]